MTGGVASKVKPKSQRVLFKDKAPVSAATVISDPVDSDLVDADDENLGGGSVTEQEKAPHLGASTKKDDLPLPDQTSDTKRYLPFLYLWPGGLLPLQRACRFFTCIQVFCFHCNTT